MIKVTGFYVNYFGETADGDVSEWKVSGPFEFSNEKELAFFRNGLVNTFLKHHEPPMGAETFEERAEFLARVTSTPETTE